MDKANKPMEDPDDYLRHDPDRVKHVLLSSPESDAQSAILDLGQLDVITSKCLNEIGLAYEAGQISELTAGKLCDKYELMIHAIYLSVNSGRHMISKIRDMKTIFSSEAEDVTRAWYTSRAVKERVKLFKLELRHRTAQLRCAKHQQVQQDLERQLRELAEFKKTLISPEEYEAKERDLKQSIYHTKADNHVLLRDMMNLQEQIKYKEEDVVLTRRMAEDYIYKLSSLKETREVEWGRLKSLLSENQMITAEIEAANKASQMSRAEVHTLHSTKLELQHKIETLLERKKTLADELKVSRLKYNKLQNEYETLLRNDEYLTLVECKRRQEISDVNETVKDTDLEITRGRDQVKKLNNETAALKKRITLSEKTVATTKVKIANLEEELSWWVAMHDNSLRTVKQLYGGNLSSMQKKIDGVRENVASLQALVMQKMEEGEATKKRIVSSEGECARLDLSVNRNKHQLFLLNRMLSYRQRQMELLQEEQKRLLSVRKQIQSKYLMKSDEVEYLKDRMDNLNTELCDLEKVSHIEEGKKIDLKAQLISTNNRITETNEKITYLDNEHRILHVQANKKKSELMSKEAELLGQLNLLCDVKNKFNHFQEVRKMKEKGIQLGRKQRQSLTRQLQDLKQGMMRSIKQLERSYKHTSDLGLKVKNMNEEVCAFHEKMVIYDTLVNASEEEFAIKSYQTLLLKRMLDSELQAVKRARAELDKTKENERELQKLDAMQESLRKYQISLVRQYGDFESPKRVRLVGKELPRNDDILMETMRRELYLSVLENKMYEYTKLNEMEIFLIERIRSEMDMKEQKYACAVTEVRTLQMKIEERVRSIKSYEIQRFELQRQAEYWLQKNEQALQELEYCSQQVECSTTEDGFLRDIIREFGLPAFGFASKSKVKAFPDIKFLGKYQKYVLDCLPDIEDGPLTSKSSPTQHSSP